MKHSPVRAHVTWRPRQQETVHIRTFQTSQVGEPSRVQNRKLLNKFNLKKKSNRQWKRHRLNPRNTIYLITFVSWKTPEPVSCPSVTLTRRKEETRTSVMLQYIYPSSMANVINLKSLRSPYDIHSPLLCIFSLAVAFSL